MPRTGQPSTRDVEATVRAVAVLDALAEGGELGTTDLARRTGISASTVSRQLGTLARLGLVEHVAATGATGSACGCCGWRTRCSAGSTSATSPALISRSSFAQVGEAGTLSIPGDGDAITVDFVPSDRYLQGVTRLGRPSIGHASSAGKVMLAFGNVPLPRGSSRRTRRGRSRSRRRSPTEIERVRAQGWAEAVEEREVGLVRDRRAGVGRRQASWPRSSPCRARRAASTRPRCEPHLPLLLECDASAISVALRRCRPGRTRYRRSPAGIRPSGRGADPDRRERTRRFPRLTRSIVTCPGCARDPAIHRGSPGSARGRIRLRLRRACRHRARCPRSSSGRRPGIRPSSSCSTASSAR